MKKHLDALSNVFFRNLGQGGTPEDPSQPITGEMLAEIISGASSASGIKVNRQNALSLSSYWACVNLISQTIASLPLHVYQKKQEGENTVKEIASDHPVNKLLTGKVNDYMTSFAFRETLQSHVLIKGMAYAVIVRDRAMNPTRLVVVDPDKMAPELINKRRLIWHYKESATNSIPMDDLDVLVIPGLGWDGITGYSVLDKMKDSVGLGLTAEQYGSKFFANGGQPSGVLSHPKRLSDKAKSGIRQDWDRLYSGDNANRVAVLEEGLTYKTISIEPDKAQFLQTREFSVSDIARWFGIPPNMIGDNKYSTFNNSENQSINFVRYTMRPWFVRWEEQLNAKLFRENNNGEFYTKFNADSLLRGTTKERYGAFAIGRQWGWLSVNDIRDKEDLRPIDGGDTYLEPLNMKDVEDPVDDDEDDNGGKEEKSSRSIGTGQGYRVIPTGHGAKLAKLQKAVASRQANSEIVAIEKRLKNSGADGFDDWICSFMAKQVETISRNCLINPEIVERNGQDLIDSLSIQPEIIQNYRSYRETDLLKLMGQDNETS